MKLIIAGSRRFPSLGLNYPKDWKINKASKNKIIEIVYNLVVTKFNVSELKEIVSGKSWGIDNIGEHIADILGIPVKAFPADWNDPLLGKGAGFARNVEMAHYADALLSVHAGSNGSKHMIEQMKNLNKLYIEEIIK